MAKIDSQLYSIAQTELMFRENLYRDRILKDKLLMCGIVNMEV
jgi:hypothetical protein